MLPSSLESVKGVQPHHLELKMLNMSRKREERGVVCLMKRHNMVKSTSPMRPGSSSRNGSSSSSTVNYLKEKRGLNIKDIGRIFNKEKVVDEYKKKRSLL